MYDRKIYHLKEQRIQETMQSYYENIFMQTKF